jgi:hypothetical protein
MIWDNDRSCELLATSGLYEYTRVPDTVSSQQTSTLWKPSRMLIMVTLSGYAAFAEHEQSPIGGDSSIIDHLDNRNRSPFSPLEAVVGERFKDITYGVVRILSAR